MFFNEYFLLHIFVDIVLFVIFYFWNEHSRIKKRLSTLLTNDEKTLLAGSKKSKDLFTTITIDNVSYNLYANGKGGFTFSKRPI